jgi:prepilin-type N-terminal cleavage/methylation domain-containing protein
MRQNFSGQNAASADLVLAHQYCEGCCSVHPKMVQFLVTSPAPENGAKLPENGAKLNDRRRQQHGFTLVEVLVVTGLLGIVAIGLATLMTNMSKMNATMTSTMTIGGLQHDLQAGTSFVSLCLTALGGKHLQAPLPAAPVAGSIWPTTAASGQDIQVQIPGTTDIAGGGLDMPTYNALGTHVYLSNGVQLPDDTLGNHVFFARMTLSATTKTGQLLAPRLVGSITLSQDPGTKNIVSCNSAGAPMHQTTCYKVPWGSKAQNLAPQVSCQNGLPSGGDPTCDATSTAWCKPGDYVAAVVGAGITTGGKRDFGYIYCCTP